VTIRGLAHGLLLAALLGLGACQSSPAARIDEDVSIGQGTRRVVINYLIAHGMAESYVMSGRATPADLLDLVRYDHAALMAIRGHEADPSWKSLSRATGAVRALMDYTTVMDTSATLGGEAAARPVRGVRAEDGSPPARGSVSIPAATKSK
jgi:hypothetical protein